MTKNDVKPASGNTAQRVLNEDLQQEIPSFYARMVEVKEGYSPIADNSLSLADAEFITEATYNYYIARNSYESGLNYQFNIQVPVSEGMISEGSLSNAFWAIKDSLLVAYDSISYSGKALQTFDVSVSTVGSVAVYHIDAEISNGPALTSSETTTSGSYSVLNTASNHVYQFGGWAGFGNTISSKGQADINLTTLALSSSPNLAKPGAAALLRNLGKMNASNFNGAMTSNQMIINVATVDVGPSYLAQSSLPSPYNSIPGVGGYNIYSFNHFYDRAGFGAVSIDPDEVIKNWLTTDAMNFYLNIIPGQINSAVPVGKVGLDFKIESKSCLCGSQLITTNVYGIYYEYKYQIKVGELSNITLPNGTDLRYF